MIRPFSFLFGYRILRISRSAAGELMNLCHARGFVYRDFEFCGEYACFSCSLSTAGKIREACAERGIAVVVEKAVGLPDLFWRYRHRAGIFVGILLFGAIVFFSGRVIWDIRVEGNRELSDMEVLEELREQGLEIGVCKKGLNIGALENRVLIDSDTISWISVNVIGTVANVEIRERQPLPEETEYTAANLVASREGTIEWFEDVRGNIVTKIGEPVSRGELLVSGIYGDEQSSMRYTAARGKVFARTTHDFSVEIPLTSPQKRYTGKVKVEKYLIFFKKEVKFFANTGNSPSCCDTIDTVEYAKGFRGYDLPVGIRTVRYLEYTEVNETQSAEAATERALYELRCQIAGEIPDAELLRKNISRELTDSAYRLHCRVECIENIAEIKEIKVEGMPVGRKIHGAENSKN